MINNIKIISCAMDLGSKCLGVAEGPRAFFDNGIVAKLGGAGFDVSESEQVTVADRADCSEGADNLRYLDEIVRVSENLASSVEKCLAADQKVAPVVIGGDHSIDLGAYSGAAKVYGDKLGMLYIDAHGDINTHETSMTGNIHGMHLASLLGFGDSRLVDVYYPGVKLKKNNLLHIASVDMDQPELLLVESEKLKFISLLDIMADGLRPVLSAIDELLSRVDYLWVSLDLDSIDRMYSPAAAMPNPSGLTFREIDAIARYVGHTGKVVGMDVVEFDPSKDIDHKTAELGIELIAKFLGKNYSWYSNYLSSQK
jgi:arginase